MNAATWSLLLLLGVPPPTAPAPAEAPRVVLRTAAGRFFGVNGNDPLRPLVYLPGKAETFELVQADPLPLLVRDALGRVYPPEEKLAEVYRLGELPALLRTVLAGGLLSAAEEQLLRKPYDKTTTRKIRKTVTLPAPTLQDLERKKTHTLLSMAEQYRLQAELDGKPDIRLTQLPLLRNYRQPQARLLLVGVEAALAVRGRVQYKLPDLASASTGYRTTVHLAAAAEAAIVKSGDKLSIPSVVVRDIQIELHDLKLSNDVLQVVRHAIQDILNHELRSNHERVLQKANTAVGKAIAAKEFQHPLLRWLELP